ncbi:MAG: Smr/MutS family protein [Nonlabens sp.]
MYKKGDRVSVVDEDLCGVVAFAKAEQVTFHCQDGFSHTRSITELIADRPLPDLNSNDFEVKNEEKPKKIKKAVEKIIEVDLHLHEIVKFENQLSNHDKVLAQLNYARKKFEAAELRGVQKIIFIHGVGKGRLKAELLKFLRGKTSINFYDADYRKYGRGATEVNFYKVG